MNTRDILDLAKMELALMQQQIDKYDDVGYKIKAWTITLWVTLFGWALQFDNPKVVLLGGFAVVVFYALDAINKNFRQDYKARRDRVADALRHFGRTDDWPEDFQTPEMPRHLPNGAIRQLIEPHVMLVYLPLIIISLTAYFLRR